MSRWNKRWMRWMDRRIPPARHITLNQKNLFIIPTKAGYSFLLVAVLIFLAAVNYRNSISYGVSFFMVALFQVALWQTWRNLAGITLTARSTEPGHAGASVQFLLACRGADGGVVKGSAKRLQQGIRIGWPDKGEMVRVDPQGSEVEVAIPYPASKRGPLHPPRLKVETVYPLGLFRAWSWVDLGQKVNVWPALQTVKTLQSESFGEDGHRVVPDGMDDFDGFRGFTSTDSASQVDWKVWARSDELVVRQFHGLAGDDLWLDLKQAVGPNLEQKLSWLASHCVRLGAGRRVWGLRLGGKVLAPSQGVAHVQACLDALALYGLDSMARK